jgi:hypothetical protein
MSGILALKGIEISGSLKTIIPLEGARRRNVPGYHLQGLLGPIPQGPGCHERHRAGEDPLPAIELASPAFIEAILKAYRMADPGATTATGEIFTDEQGKPIRRSGGEAAALAMAFRPESLARVSSETMPVFAGAFTMSLKS